MKKNLKTNIVLTPEPAEPIQNYNPLIETDVYTVIEDEKNELIEHIQETFGKGRNEVQAMIIGYDN
jgi:hypothetical protein